MASNENYGLTQRNLQNMEERHEQTLKSIQELQNIEKQLIQQLNTKVASNTSTKEEQEQLINRINELSQMRVDLFRNLQDVYKNTKDNVATSRSNLVNQLTTTQVVENEMNNVKGNLASLKSDKYNKLRMVEINNNLTGRYRAYINLFQLIVIVMIPIIIIGFLAKSNIIPDGFLSRESINDILLLLLSVTLLVGLYYILRKAFDISTRDNMNFDEYNWNFNPANQPGVIEYDQKQLGMMGGAMKKNLSSLEGKMSKYSGGCVGSQCCDKGTVYDHKTSRCVLPGHKSKGGKDHHKSQNPLDNITKTAFNMPNDVVNMGENIHLEGFDGQRQFASV
jgi:hypothetical protein